MSSDRIRIRVRSGQNEAEIEAEIGQMRDIIALIPEITSKFPESRPELRHVGVSSDPISPSASPVEARSPAEIPAIAVEKGDSLSDIISKFFADQWGKSPRKLAEVRSALQSYGLNYPKQSVTVALLRLAKSSRIRRFKSEGGEYVYTASTSSMPSQILILPDSEEPLTELESSANI